MHPERAVLPFLYLKERKLVSTKRFPKKFIFGSLDSLSAYLCLTKQDKLVPNGLLVCREIAQKIQQEIC